MSVIHIIEHSNGTQSKRPAGKNCLHYAVVIRLPEDPEHGYTDEEPEYAAWSWHKNEGTALKECGRARRTHNTKGPYCTFKYTHPNCQIPSDATFSVERVSRIAHR